MPNTSTEDPLARDAEKLQAFDLATLAKGESIHVKTEASEYWMTRGEDGRATNGEAWCFSVMHTSGKVGQICASPHRVAITRSFKLGERLTFFVNGKSVGQTGEIEMIRRALKPKS